MLSKYFQSRRTQVLAQSTIRQEAGKSARGDAFDELYPSESRLDPRKDQPGNEGLSHPNTKHSDVSVIPSSKYT